MQPNDKTTIAHPSVAPLLCRLLGHQWKPQWTPILSGCRCLRCDATRPLTAAEAEDIHSEACT